MRKTSKKTKRDLYKDSFQKDLPRLLDAAKGDDVPILLSKAYIMGWIQACECLRSSDSPDTMEECYDYLMGTEYE